VVLDGFGTGLTGTNANGFEKLGNKNLAVANFSCTSGIGDCFDNLLKQLISDRQFDFCFRKKVDNVFGTAVQLCVPSLPAEAFDFRYGYSLNADIGNGLTNVVELEGLYDGFDFFHRWRFLRPIRPVLTNHPFQARCRRQAGQAYHSPVAVPLPGECVCAYTE